MPKEQRAAVESFVAENASALDAPVDVENAVDPVYERRRQEAAEMRERKGKAKVAHLDRALRFAWDKYKSNDAPTYDDLTEANKVDWMRSVDEWRKSADPNKDALLTSDQRELSRFTTKGINQDVGKLEGRVAARNITDIGRGASERPRLVEEGVATPARGQRGGPPNDRDGQAVVGALGSPRAGGAESANAADGQRVTPKLTGRGKNPKFGVQSNPTAPATRAEFDAILTRLTSASTNARVHIFDTEADAISAIEQGNIPNTDVDALKKVRPYGWVEADAAGTLHAHFILDRIPAGGAMAAFMHEVGGHIGVDTVLNPKLSKQISTQINDWVKKKDGSPEYNLAVKALARVEVGLPDAAFTPELTAYFLEEAVLSGVTPQDQTAIGAFVGKIYDAFVAALARFGLANAKTLTPQDIVNAAYGAARIELTQSLLGTQDAAQPFIASSGVKPKPPNAKPFRERLRSAGGDTAVRVFDDMQEYARTGANALKFLHEFVRDSKDTMPSAGRWYQGMLAAEKTRNDIRAQVEPIAALARGTANRAAPPAVE